MKFNHKVKVIANPRQLEDIGISRELTNEIVFFHKEFEDGYAEVEAKIRPEILELLGANAKPEFYDIPKYWLEEISNE